MKIKKKKETTLNFNYEENLIQLKSNSIGFGHVITLDGQIYKAEKIIFHTPSDHTIDGKQFDLEMQIIHNGITQENITKHIVVSILFQKRPGVYNRFIDNLDFFDLPSKKNPIKKLKLDINKNIFIPDVFFNSDSDEISAMKPKSFYTYQGSISFPPCEERTINYVFSEIINLSSTAIQLFKEAIKMPDYKDRNGNVFVGKKGYENNRKTQPLNGRKVFFYDHVIYCGEDQVVQKKKKKDKFLGHYEKINKKLTQYLYVGSEGPSGLPNSFVVTKDEANGVK